MQKAIDHPPRTIMEVFQGLPEGTLAELIDNQIYMSPSPIFKHQKLLNQINFQFLTHFRNGSNQVLVAPFDVYLDETSNAVQPDIIIVLEQNLSIINENGHIHGVPDLLVEVLSPGNKDHDLIRKKDLYERFGVKEYWIADPDTNLVLGYQLVNKSFEKIHEEIGTFQSPLLDLSFSF